MPMTPKQADKAIKSGQPVEVETHRGERLKVTLTSRDRRYVRGIYEWRGTVIDGTFYRSDLTIVQ